MVKPNAPGKGCSDYASDRPARDRRGSGCGPSVQDATRLPAAEISNRSPRRGGEGGVDEPKKDAEARNKGEGELVVTTPGLERASMH
jgi:hypothetical protein